MSELRARVISQEKGLYQISSGTEVKQASVSGKFRYEAQTVSDYPAVGDYVLAEWQEAGSPAIIRSLFPRKSCFLRKAAGSARSRLLPAIRTRSFPTSFRAGRLRFSAPPASENPR